MNELRAKFVLDLTGNIDRRTRDISRDIQRMSRDSVDAVGRLDREFNSLNARIGRGARALNSRVASLGNRYTALAAGAAAVVAGRQSAQLDKRLKLIQQTAGATNDQASELRETLFSLNREFGAPVDSSLGGFENLVQAGQSWSEALATTRAIAPAMTVTGSAADTLAGSLSVAARAFDFDLSQPGVAAEILDRMTVAGRLGNAELEDLSAIFGRVGVNAKAANLGFSDTLGFIEELSQIERDPSRLATLADSTLRLFTNDKYRQKAEKALRVPFFNKDGSARDALNVLDDIAAKYKTIRTDAVRARFIAAGFGETDLDTQRGLRTLLAGDALSNIRDASRQIENAGGSIARDLPDAMDNAIDQAARLKGYMRDAADAFAQPVNRALTNAIDRALAITTQLGITPEAALGTGAGVTAGAIGIAKGVEFFSNVRGQTEKWPLFVKEVAPISRQIKNSSTQPGNRTSPGKGGMAGQVFGPALYATGVGVSLAMFEDSVRHEFGQLTGNKAQRQREIDQVKNYSIGGYYSDLLNKWFGWGAAADKAAQTDQVRRGREAAMTSGAGSSDSSARAGSTPANGQVDVRLSVDDERVKVKSVDVRGSGVGRIDVGDTQGPQVNP